MAPDLGLGGTQSAVADLGTRRQGTGDGDSGTGRPGTGRPGTGRPGLGRPGGWIEPPSWPDLRFWRDLERPVAGPLRRRKAGRRRSATPGKPAGRQVSALVAVPLIALLAMLALVMVVTIGGLISVGLYSASGAAAAAGPLVVPAPQEADSLPQHYQPLRNEPTIALIAEFVRRFTLYSGSQTGQPAGLYHEPAIIDQVTDQPGWVQYEGFNSKVDLGTPATTVASLMTDLLANPDPKASWRVPPGPRGGSARCAIATVLKTPVSVCAWATDRTAGALLSPLSDTRGNELATLMPLMRMDLQPGPGKPVPDPSSAATPTASPPGNGPESG